jgi:hypothetical protein
LGLDAPELELGRAGVWDGNGLTGNLAFEEHVDLAGARDEAAMRCEKDVDNIVAVQDPCQPLLRIEEAIAKESADAGGTGGAEGVGRVT